MVSIKNWNDDLDEKKILKAISYTYCEDTILQGTILCGNVISNIGNCIEIIIGILSKGIIFDQGMDLLLCYRLLEAYL